MNQQHKVCVTEERNYYLIIYFTSEMCLLSKRHLKGSLKSDQL